MRCSLAYEYWKGVISAAWGGNKLFSGVPTRKKSMRPRTGRGGGGLTNTLISIAIGFAVIRNNKKQCTRKTSSSRATYYCSSRTKLSGPASNKASTRSRAMLSTKCAPHWGQSLHRRGAAALARGQNHPPAAALKFSLEKNNNN